MPKRRTPRKRAFTIQQARDRARALTVALSQAQVIRNAEHIEFAGSLRRREDTVHDLDVLLIDLTDDQWARLAGVPDLDMAKQGDTAAQGMFRDIQVDFRRTTCQSAGAALEYFTGPKGHNIGMRAKAKRQGLKLNERGLFDVQSGDRVAGRTERGIYDALGHPWKRPGDRRSNPPLDIWDLQQGSAWVVVPTNGVINAKGAAVMGKGMAAQAAKRFPPTHIAAAHWRDPRTHTEMERAAYDDPGLAAALGERLRLAKRSYPDDPFRWNKPFRFDEYKVFTFPTKFSWRQPADLALIEESAKRLADMIVNYGHVGERLPLYKRQHRLQVGGAVPFDHECPVFMPHVGAGLGGLKWSEVEPVIREHLGALVTIVPPPDAKPKRTRVKKPATRQPTKRRTAATRRARVRANPPAPKSWDTEAATEWVWPVIECNWAAINRVVSRYGTPDWDNLVACGAMGCIIAFTDNARLVIKITTDETEGAITQRLLDTGLDAREPGLTRFQGIWRLDVPPDLVVESPSGFTDMGGDGDALEVVCAFLIVREAVQPWSADEAAGYADKLGRLGIIRPDRQGGYDLPWAAALSDVMGAGAIGDWTLFEHACAALEEFPETHDLGRAYLALYHKNLVVGDQHFDNLGFRLYAEPGKRRILVEWLDGVPRPPLLSLDLGQSDIPGLDLTDPANCDVVTSIHRANS